MDRIVYIYSLSDPITKEIRYIGKTTNPIQRFRAHINRARKHPTHKWNWINSLKKKDLRPVFAIIDEVNDKDWIFWERYWISQFKTWGFKLVNCTEGGDGLSVANKTSFKKNHIPWNKGILHSKETKERIRKTLKKQDITAPNARKVEQYDKQGNFIKEYENMSKASRETKVHISKICVVCKGQRKTAGGFKWKYKNE